MIDWKSQIESAKTFLRALNYSLPVRLLAHQVQHHKFLLLFWAFLLLLVGRQLFNRLGAPYLFLEPEYLNEFGFGAMFLLGAGFGVFCLAWQLTCYILDGHEFFFLAEIKRPFITFSLNNSLPPTLFWAFYAAAFVGFQADNPLNSSGAIAGQLTGLFLGGAAVAGLSLGYFHLTNQDVGKSLGKRLLDELTHTQVVKEARRTMAARHHVDYYLRLPYGLGRTPSASRLDFRATVRLLNQNHANGLALEGALFILLTALGAFSELPYMRIPAGASFMLLFSFALMLIGAVSFWLRRAGPLALALSAAFFFFVINRADFFVAEHPAFGLSYAVKPAPYSAEALRKLTSESRVTADSLRTIRILNAWKARNADAGAPDAKPRLALLCVSGGGNRSAVWTMACLQELGRRTGGDFFRRTALITGASGGMIGAGYYRELHFQRLNNPSVHPGDSLHLQRAARDLLNPLIFDMTTNWFLPLRKFKDARTGERYLKDRGYVFEQQLAENLNAFSDRRLGDYAAAEEAAKIPLLFLTPGVVNDGRKLLISSQPAAYMARPERFNPAYENEIPVAEFRRLFSRHAPDNLRFSSALRMNATFPGVLPFVELPTKPMTEVMDAGVIDNYGPHTAVQFLYHFREWIAANTGGVVLVQIRDTPREQPIPPDPRRTLLRRLGNALGGTYISFSESKDFIADEALAYARQWLGAPFDVVELQYIPERQFENASLSFHLTEREKQDVLAARSRAENQRAFAVIDSLLRGPAN